MSQPTEIRINTGALELRALAWGEVSAPPLLALHGWLDNAATFERIAPLLAGYRLIALDFAGHGHSMHRPAGVHYHFVDHVADVVDVLDALQLEQCALLGHSLGAAVATFVAAVVPDRIVALALIEGFGPTIGKAESLSGQLRESQQQMSRVAEKRAPEYADLRDAATARALVSDFGLEEALILARHGTQNRGEKVTWRSDPKLRVKSPSYLHAAQVDACLRDIRAPTMLIRADQGYLRKRPELETRYQCVAQLQLRDLPGGHHLHLQTPAPVAALLAEFLAAEYQVAGALT